MDTAYEVALDDDTDDDPVTGKVLVPGGHPGSAGRRSRRGSGCRSSRFTCARENLRATIRRALARAGSCRRVPRGPVALVRLQAGLVRRSRLRSRSCGNQMRWWWVPNSFALEQKAADAQRAEGVGEDPPPAQGARGCGVAAFWRLRTSVCHQCPDRSERRSRPPLSRWPVRWLRSLRLAHYGRPAGQTLVGTAVVAPRFRKLNSDIVLRAYYAAGLGKPDKADQEVRFGSPMSRDARNTGSQVVVDLPYGKGWSDVAGARGRRSLPVWTCT